MQTLMFGDDRADIALIQPVDMREAVSLEAEFALIRQLTGGASLSLTALVVDDWNRDLSPWPSPAVFGREGFVGGASGTLSALMGALPGGRRALGGYSLAGLFALWACCETDAFSACAAASPSVWFPGWIEYATAHPMRAECAYLSLGDREEKTRNRTMAAVGDSIRRLDALYAAQDGLRHTLEWNAGNHFAEPELRTAKAFAWCVNQLTKSKGMD